MYNFDFDSGHLVAERADGLKFDFILRKFVTIVQGNSATGKTLLCRLIENLNPRNDNRNVQIFNYADKGRDGRLETIFNLENKLIIIDNADVLLSDRSDIVDFIDRTKHKSQFLIFARCITFKRTPNYFGYLEKTGNVITIAYNTSVSGWF